MNKTNNIAQCDWKECSNLIKFSCSVCKDVQYCSKECQKLDWNTPINPHKKICKSLKLKKEAYERKLIEELRQNYMTELSNYSDQNLVGRLVRPTLESIISDIDIFLEKEII